MFQGAYTGNRDFILKFCFGIALHPCANPINMEVYLMAPDYQVVFEKTVHDDEMYQIPRNNFIYKIMQSFQFRGHNFLHIA